MERELHFFFFNLKTLATSVWNFFWVHLFGFLALLKNHGFVPACMLPKLKSNPFIKTFTLILSLFRKVKLIGKSILNDLINTLPKKKKNMSLITY
jgi:hypothetical protein